MAANEGMRFKVLLSDISQNLTGENLETLKFLCKDDIGKRRLETLVSGIQLFQVLEELSLLSQEDTSFLGQLLKSIKRPDLEKKLSDYQRGGEPLQPPMCEVGRNSDVDVAIDVIRDNIGRDWRMLARKLGFKEARLQEIEYGDPRNMQLQISKTLQEWQEVKGQEATVECLVTALRNCRLNMIADSVQEEVNKNR
ncbi:FAS-associated death domain protein isoform X1 [Mobula birostris]|uniref:FAS-associated death domain protein isoform X1 n=1 Tax=Mobula birostris TaxID=1983395 RepID=UPI003B284C64